MSARDNALRGVEGATIGIALWCALYALHVLPGRLDDDIGVMSFAALGILAVVSALRRMAFASLAFAALLVAIVALSPMSQTIANRWVREDAVPSVAIAAVVVLSGGVNPDTTISSESLDHLIDGLELIRHWHSPVLVTTTTREVFPTGTVSSDVDQSRVIALIDPGIKWLRVPGGRSTRDEAVATAAHLLPGGARQIAVVASPMHTRRACAVFEAVGFSVTCVPARLRTPGARPLSPGPTDRLTIFGQWIYEITALAKYRLHGWLPMRQSALASA